ncbi:long-chain-fatty-acid--CoA ligase [mine drainage metagenome]|uniref:Long-chain-fatty-acid--CoA ligase n=1 Tax=mine drainage metagenome TaxID=410659 RepID=A0A1J5PIV0_9ZZZZ
MERIWLANYPAGVPADIDPDAYANVAQVLERSFTAHAARPAYAFMGRKTSYAQWGQQSRALAAYFQSLGLKKGDRVAVMMPNVPQYPATVAAILRAGLVVVNVNPLYTPRELEHQLKDSGAIAVVILENFAHTLQQVMTRTAVKHVLVANMGETLGFPLGPLVNYVVRHKRRLVPSWSLPGHVRWKAAVRAGAGLAFEPPPIGAEDIALLQYTGGTTGVAKGATLTQRNIVANIIQSGAWYGPALKRLPADAQLNTICALPLYHIFAFTVIMMLTAYEGGMMILIPNPRDLPGTLKELAKYELHSFPAVNTLYNGLLNHPDFDKINWRTLMLCVGGGMAVQEAVAKRWLERTGCPICEGYGLSETSPSAICNPTDTDRYSGSIGMPLPSTELALVDDDGREVAPGLPGEIALRGPQVMHSYWNRPDETAKTFTADGFLRTGDIGEIDARGYVKIIDRKKDMILVSGFNVYPNEVEAVAVMHPGVLEAAAVGVPDVHSGEAVKLFIVKKDQALTEQQLRDFLHEQLTGYKRPKFIEFRSELPKTPVGKILRRELRT